MSTAQLEGVLPATRGHDGLRAVGLAACLTLIAAVALLSYASLQAVIDDIASIRQSQEVMYEIAAVSNAIDDAESSQRGYLISGNSDFLQDYKTNADTTLAAISRLRSLVKTDPAQIQHLDALTPQIQERLSLLSENLAYRTSAGFTTPDPARFARGKQLMQGVDDALSAMLDNERNSLPGRTEAAIARERSILDLMLFGSMGSVIFVAAIFLFINREVKRRRAADGGPS